MIRRLLRALSRRAPSPGEPWWIAAPSGRSSRPHAWPKDQVSWIGENGVYRPASARQALAALAACGVQGGFSARSEGGRRIVTGPASAVVLADPAAEADFVALLGAIARGDAGWGDAG